MTLYRAKPAFQRLLRPCVIGLHRCGVTANQITLFAIVTSISLGFLLSLYANPAFFFLLPVFLFFRMALNAIDGMLARDFKQQSTLGALLNEIGDVLSDAALYITFAWLPGVDARWVFLMVFLAGLTEFCGVLAQTIGAPRGYAGPMGKSDRALILGTYALVISVHPPFLSYSWPFMVFAVLLLYTSINRCRIALNQAS